VITDTGPTFRPLTAGVLAPAQAGELTAYRDKLNPASIGRQIADLQAVLLKLAKDKTEQLLPRQLPHRPARRRQGHPDQGLLTSELSRAFLVEGKGQVSRAY
jgi:hypothetical protein